MVDGRGLPFVRDDVTLLSMAGTRNACVQPSISEDYVQISAQWLFSYARLVTSTLMVYGIMHSHHKLQTNRLGFSLQVKAFYLVQEVTSLNDSHLKVTFYEL